MIGKLILHETIMKAEYEKQSYNLSALTISLKLERCITNRSL